MVSCINQILDGATMHQVSRSVFLWRCTVYFAFVYMQYLGPSQQLCNKPYRFQVALSQKQPPLLHCNLHLQLLLLLLLLSSHPLQVSPFLSLPKLLLSLPQLLFLSSLFLLLFLLLLFPV